MTFGELIDYPKTLFPDPPVLRHGNPILPMLTKRSESKSGKKPYKELEMMVPNGTLLPSFPSPVAPIPTFPTLPFSIYSSNAIIPPILIDSTPHLPPVLRPVKPPIPPGIPSSFAGSHSDKRRKKRSKKSADAKDSPPTPTPPPPPPPPPMKPQQSIAQPPMIIQRQQPMVVNQIAWSDQLAMAPQQPPIRILPHSESPADLSPKEAAILKQAIQLASPCSGMKEEKEAEKLRRALIKYTPPQFLSQQQALAQQILNQQKHLRDHSMDMAPQQKILAQQVLIAHQQILRDFRINAMREALAKKMEYDERKNKKKTSTKNHDDQHKFSHNAEDNNETTKPILMEDRPDNEAPILSQGAMETPKATPEPVPTNPQGIYDGWEEKEISTFSIESDDRAPRLPLLVPPADFPTYPADDMLPLPPLAPRK